MVVLGVCPVPSGEIKAAVAGVPRYAMCLCAPGTERVRTVLPEVHEKTLAAMKRVVAELDEKKVDVW
eukprot:148940-Rhodomonas_salina.2